MRIPDLNEQKKLVQISSVFDSLLNLTKLKVLKLTNLKKATCNELLSGNRRVKF